MEEHKLIRCCIVNHLQDLTYTRHSQSNPTHPLNLWPLKYCEDFKQLELIKYKGLHHKHQTMHPPSDYHIYHFTQAHQGQTPGLSTITQSTQSALKNLPVRLDYTKSYLSQRLSSEELAPQNIQAPSKE